MAADTVEIASVGEYWGHHTVPHQLTMTDLRQMRRNFTGPTVIDYEHSSHDPEADEAPAAGWVTDVFIEDDTLMGTVEWTERAAEMIDADEYRFLSPVIVKNRTDKSGASIGTELVTVALTNIPFYDHLNGDEGVAAADEGVATIPPMTDEAVLNTRFQNDDTPAGDGPESPEPNQPSAMDWQERFEALKNRLAGIFNSQDAEELSLLDEARQLQQKVDELEEKLEDHEEIVNERDQLKDRVDELEDAVEEQEEIANKELLDEAVDNFRIQASDREDWEERLDENPEAARMALNSIPKGAAKPGSGVEEPEETGSGGSPHVTEQNAFQKYARGEE